MEWSLLDCGRRGHVTYAPAETDLRAQLSALTPEGQAWRCLRCGTFVPGPADGSGPADKAPTPLRGKEIRSAIVLRIFAVERFLRAIVFGVIAWAIWEFGVSRVSLERAFDKDYPAIRSLFRQLGYDVGHSKVIGLIHSALTVSPNTIKLIAGGVLAYALLETVEGIGLWLEQRWGEYFAMIVTSLGLPYEIYDLTDKITVTRIIFFLVNLALVIYLVVTRRLFGVRGGKEAYEARLRIESVIQEARNAIAAAHPSPATPATPATPASGAGGSAAD
ncbi:MAG TPA: DUF2127 domain-containing protein [Streptosporangiaceae bacterium]